MQVDPEAARRSSMRHTKAAKPRDAMITFLCLPHDSVQVGESIHGKIAHSQTVKRRSDIVTELEKRYIFFADEARTARKQISRGHSCVFSVYLREP
jgi:hypothetical protein